MFLLDILEFDGPLLDVYGWCSQYGRCMVHTLAGTADAWFIRTLIHTWNSLPEELLQCRTVDFLD